MTVFALYPRNRFVWYFLLSVYVSEIVALSASLGFAVPELEYDELCVVTSNPVTFLIAA